MYINDFPFDMEPESCAVRRGSGSGTAVVITAREALAGRLSQPDKTLLGKHKTWELVLSLLNAKQNECKKAECVQGPGLLPRGNCLSFVYIRASELCIRLGVGAIGWGTLGAVRGTEKEQGSLWFVLAGELKVPPNRHRRPCLLTEDACQTGESQTPACSLPPLLSQREEAIKSRL